MPKIRKHKHKNYAMISGILRPREEPTGILTSRTGFILEAYRYPPTSHIVTKTFEKSLFYFQLKKKSRAIRQGVKSGSSALQGCLKVQHYPTPKKKYKQTKILKCFFKIIEKYKSVKSEE